MSVLLCPSLRQLDVEFMKRLSHSVNIIPVIAKADTMTIEERQEFKQRVSFTSGSIKARLINVQFYDRGYIPISDIMLDVTSTLLFLIIIDMDT